MSNEVKNALSQCIDRISDNNKIILNSLKDDILNNINLFKTVFVNRSDVMEESVGDCQEEVCKSNKKVSNEIKNLTEVFSNLTNQLNEQYNKLANIMNLRNDLTNDDKLNLNNLIEMVNKKK